MNLYPALRARMGTWDYYMVKLTMREVSAHVNFAADIHQDHTLNQAIQRTLAESRAKKEIVAYLQRQEHRFFSSLVIAALEGNPKWYPIMLADDPQFTVFKDDERLNSTFGVLKFDGTQNYYALDGQHRLAAIKHLLDPSEDAWSDAPAGFADEEISVILVTPRGNEEHEEFMLRYRRLFGNINRHARATSHFTNIVMDEDDTFAILTRRLITEHEFFMSPSPRQKESTRIKMKKGKNVSSRSPVFTSLEQLYAVNKTLLISKKREYEGWSSSMFVRFRRDDDELDQLFEELVDIWNALIETLPLLMKPPDRMRCHDREGNDQDVAEHRGCVHDRLREEGLKKLQADPELRKFQSTIVDQFDEFDECDDSALFWPITQDMIARLARQLLDANDGGNDATVKRLAPLADLEYSLHRPPWRYVFLIPNEGGRGGPWKIRSEERRDAIDVLESILGWQLGLHPLNVGERDELRAEWKALLVPQWEGDYGETRRQQLWAQIEQGRRL